VFLLILQSRSSYHSRYWFDKVKFYVVLHAPLFMGLISPTWAENYFKNVVKRFKYNDWYKYDYLYSKKEARKELEGFKKREKVLKTLHPIEELIMQLLKTVITSDRSSILSKSLKRRRKCVIRRLQIFNNRDLMWNRAFELLRLIDTVLKKKTSKKVLKKIQGTPID